MRSYGLKSFAKVTENRCVGKTNFLFTKMTIYRYFISTKLIELKYL